MESQLCGICLETYHSRGQIDSCNHQFHFMCIFRWSNITNHCPVCRLTFSQIIHYRGQTFVKRVAVRTRQPNAEDSPHEDNDWGVCVVCQGGSDSDEMIYCDGEDGTCMNAYHLQCAGLSSVPVEQWLCPVCASVQDQIERRSDEASEFSDEEVEDDEDDEVSLVESSEGGSGPDYDVDSVNSDPEAEYVPESSPLSNSEEEEQDDDSSFSEIKVKKRYTRSRPKPSREGRKLRKISRKECTTVQPMSTEQRKRLLKRHHSDQNLSTQDTVDEAWIIFNSMPQKRQRESPVREIINCKPMGYEQFRQYVEKFVIEEFSALQNDFKISERLRDRIKRQVISKIIKVDKGKHLTDARSMQKMRMQVKSALMSCQRL